jgi:hypothetical protein
VNVEVVSWQRINSYGLFVAKSQKSTRILLAIKPEYTTERTVCGEGKNIEWLLE